MSCNKLHAQPGTKSGLSTLWFGASHRNIVLKPITDRLHATCCMQDQVLLCLA